MSPHVIIAGAGIGGLTAALALLRSGIDCDLYEQAPELREVGAGLQLAPNGTRVLFALGLEPAVRRDGVDGHLDLLLKLIELGRVRCCVGRILIRCGGIGLDLPVANVRDIDLGIGD